MSNTKMPPEPETVTGTGTSEQTSDGKTAGPDKPDSSEKKGFNLPDAGSPVGLGGLMIAASFLILLVVGLLYGITTQWPVCDFTNVAEVDNRNGNNNRNAPSNTNSNTSATTTVTVNVASNQNSNAPANRNGNSNTRTPPPVTVTPPAVDTTSTASSTKLDADSLEPNSGPITGNTPVTIKGKKFGTKVEDITVRFGALKASVSKVTEDSISVRTPMHSEGVVDVTIDRANGESDVLTAIYTYTCPPPTGTGLFYMLVMAGALGGCIHGLRSLYWYFGQGELKWRWLPMYFTLPFVGAAMAMIFSLLMMAGLVDNSTRKSEALFIIAVAGLVGMFSQQAALKLTDVANAFFTKPGPGKDAVPQKSLSVSQRDVKPPPVTATKMRPDAGKAGDEVKITGSGFSTSTSVSFGETSAQIKSFDATSITVVAPAGEGEVDVKVKSGDLSATLPTKFHYI